MVMTYGYAPENLLLTHYGFHYFSCSKRASVDFCFLYFTFDFSQFPYGISSIIIIVQRDIGDYSASSTSTDSRPTDGASCKLQTRRTTGFSFLESKALDFLGNITFSATHILPYLNLSSLPLTREKGDEPNIYFHDMTTRHKDTTILTTRPHEKTISHEWHCDDLITATIRLLHS